MNNNLNNKAGGSSLGDNALSPIFDKEKEQKRLRQAQLIGEIGNQAIDIIRTQGAIETAKP
nr:hypothetical protein [Pseudomonas sp. FEN]